MDGFISFREPVCHYCGVWQENDRDEVVSYGSVASVTVGFAGAIICIQAHFGNGICVYIDDKEAIAEHSKEGYIIKVPEGRHILKIQSVPGGRITLKGFLLKDAAVFNAGKRPYVQFIGDSITHAYPGFTDRCARLLKADYACVSTCGMSLVDGWGWYQTPDWLSVRPGMESMYFRLENVNETADYTTYRFEYGQQPDALVIFLGTNDYINNETDKENGNFEKFADHYLAFVKKLRQYYPNAKVVIMGSVSGSVYRREAIKNAVELLKSKEKDVCFMQTEEWEIEICDDGTHPTEHGYEQIAENAAEYLRKIL